MRVMTKVAAGLGGTALAVAVAASAAPQARADVGDVIISFLNKSGVVIGTDQDTFANVTTSQCDGNQPPPDTASVSITNATDQVVLTGSTCSGASTPVDPGQNLSEPWGRLTENVVAPPGP